MSGDFLHTTFGRSGWPVHRLGLSATYRPGKAAVHKALDAGLNYFFCFGLDTHMIKVLRELPARDRERCLIATGAYNYIWGHQNIARTLERRLRQLRTDYLDVFLFLGVTKGRQFTPRVQDELRRLREAGRVRAIGLSTHDRAFAGRLAAEGDVDALMVRYNAAHRGAERDIFPHLQPHNPAVVSFTATRWRYLLRRPRGWPKDRPVPTAGQCYRFVLSNPHVHVCLTAPSDVRQLEENLAAVAAGPLSAEEMRRMGAFGEAVYRRQRWFM